MKTPTTNSRFRQTNAILFRKSLFGESDLRVEFYSPQGYETVMVFGAAKEKSKKRSFLESGNILRCSLYRKSQNFPAQIRELKILWHPEKIFQSLFSASRFYFFMESLFVLLRNDQEGAYFPAISDTLKKMEIYPNQQALSLFFLFNLIYSEGHLPKSHSENQFLSQMESLLESPLQIGKGSLRFIQDSLSIQNTDFWIQQSLERDVETELIFLIRKILEVRYQRKIYSVKLFL